jgi:hypothetical protein
MKTSATTIINDEESKYQAVTVVGPDNAERNKAIDALAQNGWKIVYSKQTSTRAVILYAKEL